MSPALLNEAGLVITPDQVTAPSACVKFRDLASLRVERIGTAPFLGFFGKTYYQLIATGKDGSQITLFETSDLELHLRILKAIDLGAQSNQAPRMN
jgi:hypothetical protein